MTKTEILRRERGTKIVATVGPASRSEDMLEKLFRTGVDVFRLNFSHGEQSAHREVVDRIRLIEKRVGRPIAILLDLQGPKLRLGQIAGGSAMLETGTTFRLDLDPAPGDNVRAPLPHPEIFDAIERGTELLIDDGKVRLRVESFGKDFADVTVIVGGRISDHKGVNVPNAVLPISALTAKDRTDLDFGLSLGVDWVAMSFVQRPEDVAEGRKLIAGRAALLAKLEKPSVLAHLPEVIDLADAVMVARGDLGVETPPENVPIVQRQIVHLAREAGKPVVVATQMLESMITCPTPTRAEASDVATAVYEGADAVMLSAETAVGAYPIETVSIMDRIIRRVQSDPLFRQTLFHADHHVRSTASDAITAAARQVAETIKAAAIVTYTTSGSTTLRAARERPDVPILCLTSSMETARRFGLVWGVHAVQARDATTFSEMVQTACRMALVQGIAHAGDRIVITAGVPFGTPGATNILRIAWVQGE